MCQIVIPGKIRISSVYIDVKPNLVFFQLRLGIHGGGVVGFLATVWDKFARTLMQDVLREGKINLDFYFLLFFFSFWKIWGNPKKQNISNLTELHQMGSFGYATINILHKTWCGL